MERKVCRLWSIRLSLHFDAAYYVAFTQAYFKIWIIVTTICTPGTSSSQATIFGWKTKEHRACIHVIIRYDFQFITNTNGSVRTRTWTWAIKQMCLIFREFYADKGVIHMRKWLVEYSTTVWLNKSRRWTGLCSVIQRTTVSSAYPVLSESSLRNANQNPC